jgi:hypothetical protein
MNIRVERIRNNGDTTIGNLFVDDIFQCNTLEDEPRDKKVYGETRIPAGKYKIAFRKTGRFHNKYKERFPEFHVGMLHITNIPNFEYVLIHIGNSDEDTAGCLLVGDAEGWKLKNSTVAYKKLYKQVAAALLENEKVEIEYVDQDR